MSKNQTNIGEVLCHWYTDNARDLPWRTTKDPYLIWLSEIILQQTSVTQGLPYYYSFAHKYPTVESLAKAAIDEVLKLWEGLGYYSRARNLHYTANYIVNELDGQFPNNYKELLKLKGVGPYTAAAIASFAFKEPVVVVDGNVLRFVSRLFGISDSIDLPPIQKKIKVKAQSLLNGNAPEVFNQAIMEIGALICTPKQTKCPICPLSNSCVAFKKDLVSSLPKKTKNIKKKKRYLNYYFITDASNNTLIAKRSGNDVWKGLHEFPLVETDASTANCELPQELKSMSIQQDEPPSNYKQTLTHQLLYITIHKLKSKRVLKPTSSYTLIAIKDLGKKAWPRSLKSFLQDQRIIDKG